LAKQGQDADKAGQLISVVKNVGNCLAEIISCIKSIKRGKLLKHSSGTDGSVTLDSSSSDAVLGALESLNKKYGTSILISGDLQQEVKSHFLCRFLDVVVVCGKTTHTPIYELVSKLSEATAGEIAFCAAQGEALSLFLNKKFEESLKIYRVLGAQDPGDLSIQLLTKRVISTIQNSHNLPEDWNGYVILEDK